MNSGLLNPTPKLFQLSATPFFVLCCFVRHWSIHYAKVSHTALLLQRCCNSTFSKGCSHRLHLHNSVTPRPRQALCPSWWSPWWRGTLIFSSILQSSFTSEDHQVRTWDWQRLKGWMSQVQRSGEVALLVAHWLKCLCFQWSFRDITDRKWRSNS